MKGKKRAITEVLSVEQQRLADHNQQVLLRIIETVRFCIERGSALRGHRDAGVPSIDAEDYVNMGNFKAELASRAKFDDVLHSHLEKSKSSTYGSYLSPYAQSDIISCFLHELQSSIVAEARDQTGKFIYAVSADEVTDCSNIEQLAIVIRTVGTGGTIRERLIEYIDLDNLTGSCIASSIMDCLERHGISIKDCRAQTYDGANNMSGKVNGVQALVKEKQPLALFTHCASHRLNLALNSTNKVQEFRVLMGNIKRLGLFFKYSPKRTKVLGDLLKQADPPIAVTKVNLN